jgi:hypothetical protein
MLLLDICQSSDDKSIDSAGNQLAISWQPVGNQLATSWQPVGNMKPQNSDKHG